MKLSIIVFTIIISLIILGLFLKLLHLRTQQLNNVKKKWPKLSKNELISRKQQIHGYIMQSNVQNVYQYYEKMVLVSIMLITVGASIGGFLIANLNLTLIPLIVVCLDLAIFFVTNLNQKKQINSQYQEYIRTHLNNDLRMVTIPKKIIINNFKTKIFLTMTLLIEAFSITIITLIENKII